MLTSFKKVLLIPVLTFSTGIFFVTVETQNQPSEINIGYPEHLTGNFTGGFGEETCRSCHFDYDLNWSEGSMQAKGIPVNITPGKTYQIDILVQREQIGSAGFQVSARFRNGKQAGQFLISENRNVMFTSQSSDSLQLVQHSAEGTVPEANGKHSWKIQWGAPDIISDSVVFSISANAANGDQSEFGDWIYNKVYTVK